MLSDDKYIQDIIDEKGFKDCPFCGSSEIYLCSNWGRYGNFIYVKCDVCSGQSRTFSAGKHDERLYRAAEDAINAWNRRA